MGGRSQFKARSVEFGLCSLVVSDLWLVRADVSGMMAKSHVLPPPELGLWPAHEDGMSRTMTLNQH